MILKLTAEYKIVNPLGMHMRPVSDFVKMASRFESEVIVEKEGEVANGKSLMSLLILAAGPGTILKITVEGNDAEAALQALGNMIESGFGEL